MTNLTAVPGWDAVPQIEVTTPLKGGSGGPLNGPAQALINRIELLRTERVSVKQFGAAGDGSDATAAFQDAADYLRGKGGGRAVIPAGTYLISAAIKTDNNICFQGDGDGSVILVNSDIEVFNSDTSSPSAAIFRAEFKDFYIKSTVSGTRTKYDIHLQNPCVCKFVNVRIESGHGDTDYSATNVGGIWLDKPDASTSAAYMNRIKDCWIQNNSVYFKNITDSSISGGYVWGHTRQFAIRLQGGGANAVQNVEGIIPSKYNGGIWLDGAGINQTRIIGNEFDGNPLLDTGTGVYAPDQTIATLVDGNTLWGCDKHGLDFTDPIGLTVTGNTFWKCNAADNYYDDVRITGKTFQPNGNVVSGNTHVIDDTRTKKGCAIREVNAGFSPVNNTYSGNGVSGNYAFPAIVTLVAATVLGTGLGTENLTQMPGNQVRMGSDAIMLNTSQDVAIGGTLDFSIGTDSYVGLLNVAVTRSNYLPQSRMALHRAAAHGTAGVFDEIIGHQDGSGGGATYTLSAPASGVIRLTNTSGNAVSVRMSFFGNRAYG